ncbi:hypothetical protein ACLB2K_049433 [Fragaria x ananassa]
MVGSQPTKDIDSTPSMEQILQMFEKLNERMDGLDTIQQSVADLAEQGLATQQSITDLAGKVDGLVEQVKRNKIQQTQQKSGQTTNVLHKKIALPNSQSNGEGLPLSGPTSKQVTTSSINDEEPEANPCGLQVFKVFATFMQPFADPSIWFALGGTEVHDHLPRTQLAKCMASKIFHHYSAVRDTFVCFSLVRAKGAAKYMVIVIPCLSQSWLAIAKIPEEPFL